MTRGGRKYGTIAAIAAVVLSALIVLALATLFSAASAAPPPVAYKPVPPPIAKSTGVIPAHSVRYRLQLEREVARRFGLDGDSVVAMIAAQIHAESAWRPTAASAYAQGLAQFTPATAAWLPDICPDVGEPDPWDAAWSLRAIACYDAWLFARNRGATLCERWAFAFADYNGGAKWRIREQTLAKEAGSESLRWFGHVEHQRARSVDTWTENRNYVRRILRVLTPLYVAAGWPGKVHCT